MSNNNRFDISLPIKYGLLAGVIALSLSMIGMITLFGERDLIAGVLTLGQVILFLAPAALSYLAASKAPSGKNGFALLSGAITGFIAALPLIASRTAAYPIPIRPWRSSPVKKATAVSMAAGSRRPR